jgi:CubicO group peptidase (beta-lactamase class C family)
VPLRFGLGFGLSSEAMPIGPNPRTFFWGGWGGSLVVFDPDARTGFSYVMNKMGATTLGDMRGFGPAFAVYSCLG